MLGISVHWLKTSFIEEVESAGHDTNSTIYEIENLNGPPGVIRNKGKEVISPTDRKKGAAYVHCLEGEDNVGPATVMLSYTWGYTIGMIVETLVDWCKSKGRDLKRTYVWICCLCVNQHRIAAKKRSGITVPSEEFFGEFGNRVKAIGTVLALMGRWDSPKYFTRIWCVFEVYWANVNNGNVEVIMPQEQKDLMAASIVGGNRLEINKLYEVLSNIDIEKAGASVQEDKQQILRMIEDDIGSTKLNNRVKELFRSWVRSTICELVELKSKEVMSASSSISNSINNDVDGFDLKTYSDLCFNVGRLFWRNGEFDEAINLYEQCLKIRLKFYGENHVSVADVYGNIGIVLNNKGDYDGALLSHNKAVEIQQSLLEANHPSLARSYFRIGNVLYGKRDYEGALNQHKKSLDIRISVLDKNHPDLAKSYSNTGLALHKMGRDDDALVQIRKALDIQKHILSKNPQNVAKSYDSIGQVLREKGNFDDALMELTKARQIRESIFGENHPQTATSCNNIGRVLQDKCEYDRALTEYRKALQIQKSVLDANHPDIVESYCNIAQSLNLKGNYEEALIELKRALDNTDIKTLDPNHPFARLLKRRHYHNDS